MARKVDHCLGKSVGLRGGGSSGEGSVEGRRRNIEGGEGGVG